MPTTLAAVSAIVQSNVGISWQCWHSWMFHSCLCGCTTLRSVLWARRGGWAQRWRVVSALCVGRAGVVTYSLGVRWRALWDCHR